MDQFRFSLAEDAAACRSCWQRIPIEQYIEYGRCGGCHTSEQVRRESMSCLRCGCAMALNEYVTHGECERCRLLSRISRAGALARLLEGAA
jgi:hypothetical protein